MESQPESQLKKGNKDPLAVEKWIIGLIVLLVVAVLLLPTTGGPIKAGPRNIKNNEELIVHAIQSYWVEYSHLPGNRPDGVYEDPAGNAQIFAVLRGLDRQQNPLGIVYFEARRAVLRQRHWWKAAQLVDGFDPATGALLDFYGQPFKIRVEPDFDHAVVSPYHDLPAKKGEPMLVWSSGEDGRQGKRGDPQSYQGSDDIASWE